MPDRKIYLFKLTDTESRESDLLGASIRSLLDSVKFSISDNELDILSGFVSRMNALKASVKSRIQENFVVKIQGDVFMHKGMAFAALVSEKNEAIAA